MKRHSFGLTLVLGAVALCLGGTRANAQLEFKGTFTLDQPARWGEAVLDPGDYTIVLHSAERGSIATIRGPQKTVMVMANAAEQNASTNASSLLVIGDSKSRSIRKLHLAELGMDLYYPVGKRELELEARNRQDASSVPLIMNGK